MRVIAALLAGLVHRVSWRLVLGWTSLAILGAGIGRFVAPWCRVQATTRTALACDAPAFSFGEADADGTVKHTFVVRNTGKAPVHLLQVRPSCAGCTTIAPVPESIGPGEAVDINVKIRLAGLRHKVAKRVTLRTDEEDAAPLVLTVNGQVHPFIEIMPDRLSVSSKASTDLDVYSSKLKFNIVRATTDAPGVRATVEKVKDGSQYRVKVEAVAKLVAVERSFVILETDCQPERTIVVPLAVVAN